MSTSPAAQQTYYSAYRGSARNIRGEFEHFIRIVDPYHLSNGYWRFRFEQDEFAAYLMGFSDPEEVLIAEERDDVPTDAIELLWVPGNLDTYPIQRRGTAKQHLQDISEERWILGLPVSFGSEIPIYAVDREGKLLHHRKAKHDKKPQSIPSSNLSRSQAQPHISTAPPNSPMVNVWSSNRSSSTVATVANGADLAVNIESGSPLGQLGTQQMVRDSLQIGPAFALENVSLEARRASEEYVTRSPTPAYTPHSRIEAHQPRRLPTSLIPTNGSGPTTSYISPYASPYASQPPQHRSQSPVYSDASPVIRPANSQPATFQRRISPPRGRDCGGGQLQIDDDGGEQFRAENSQPRLAETHGSSNTRANQDGILIGHSVAGTRNVTPRERPEEVYLNTHGKTSEEGLDEGLSTSPTSTLDTSGASTLEEYVAVDSMSPAAIYKTGPSGNLPQHYNPVIHDNSASEEDGALEANHSSPDGAIHREILMPTSPIQTSEDVNPTAKSPWGHEEALDTSMHDGEQFLSTDELLPMSQEEREDAMHDDPLLAGYTYPFNISIPMDKVDVDPTDPFFKIQFPCIDCGEVESHKHDCYIGSIKPMKNLNVLQHRGIANAVERFDPEQWREHQGPPPTPKLEDDATKVTEMASLLRNEDSFKSDPDLQDLSDDALLILWALKSLTKTNCEIVWPDADTPVILETDKSHVGVAAEVRSGSERDSENRVDAMNLDG